MTVKEYCEIQDMRYLACEKLLVAIFGELKLVQLNPDNPWHWERIPYSRLLERLYAYKLLLDVVRR